MNVYENENERTTRKMRYRSITLELRPDNDIILNMHEIVDDWVEARSFHGTMRKTVEERGGRVLYASLLNLDEVDKSCCNDRVRDVTF